MAAMWTIRQSREVPGGSRFNDLYIECWLADFAWPLNLLELWARNQLRGRAIHIPEKLGGQTKPESDPNGLLSSAA